MGPLALRAFALTTDSGLRDDFARAQHFMIDDSIVSAATQLNNMQVGLPGADLFNWEMPADVVCLEVRCGLYMIVDYGDFVDYLVFIGDSPEAIGLRTWPRTNLVQKLERGHSSNKQMRHALATEHAEQIAKTVHVATIILSLIAEPRLVIRRPMPRQLRRHAARALNGICVPAWHRLSWAIGDEVAPKNSSSTSDGWRAPLHFSRAHWRHAKEGDPKAERRPGYPGWWCWVRHSIKGHPDFGIKLHHYTPKIDADGKSAATLAAAEAVLTAWRDSQ